MVDIAINAGFYESSVKPFSAQNCVNLYPVNPQNKGSVSKGALFSTPGLSQLFTLAGPGRGTIDFLTNLSTLIADVYIVAGDRFYQMTNTVAIPVDLGEIEGSDRVIMANNGFVITIIVPGAKGYVYDPDVGLTEITDPVFQSFQAQAGGVTSVVALNGYFVYTTAKEFFLGSLATTNKGKNFAGLDFSTAEIKPDDNVRAAVVDNELYIMGTKTVQRFRISGTGFPFVTNVAAAFDRGLIARHSFTEFDDSYFYVGRQEQGGIAILEASRGRVSTDAIDSVIQKYTQEEIEASFAMTYEEDGALFVCFVFPDQAFCYDATNSKLQGINIWHERKSGSSTWRVNGIIDGFNRKIVTDSLSGIIGIMDRDILSEYSSDIDREFTGSFLENGGKAFFGNQIELKTEAGVGTEAVYPATDDNDPLIEMLFSDDGGNNFPNTGMSFSVFSRDAATCPLGPLPRAVPLTGSLKDAVLDMLSRNLSSLGSKITSNLGLPILARDFSIEALDKA